MKIKILDNQLTPDMMQPKTLGSAGIDLYAVSLDEPLHLPDGQTHFIEFGVAVEIPVGYVGLLVPRSSTGRRGIRLANTVGVIDSDYRGQLKAMIISDYPVMIEPMARLFQLVVVPHLIYAVEFTDELSDTDRGQGGFGSTG